MTFVVQLQHRRCKKMPYWTSKESEYNRSTADVVLLCYCVIVLLCWVEDNTAEISYRHTEKMMPHSRDAACSLGETRSTGYVGADVCRWLTEGGDSWCRYLQKVKPQGTHQTHHQSSGSRKVIWPSQRAFPLIGIIQRCHHCQRSAGGQRKKKFGKNDACSTNKTGLISTTPNVIFMYKTWSWPHLSLCQ